VHQRQEIMTGVWGENFFGDDSLLDVYIRYLRQKIELYGASTLIPCRKRYWIHDAGRESALVVDVSLEFWSILVGLLIFSY